MNKIFILNAISLLADLLQISQAIDLSRLWHLLTPFIA